jgi:DMSO/TMAO reductase YedYZ molybdopterin-dependent catalytic subunit
MHSQQDIIISPDTEKENRVPPGQRVRNDWPVLHDGEVPGIDTSTWMFRIWGLVEKERVLNFEEFMALPRVRVFSDIHGDPWKEERYSKPPPHEGSGI